MNSSWQNHNILRIINYKHHGNILEQLQKWYIPSAFSLWFKTLEELWLSRNVAGSIYFTSGPWLVTSSPLKEIKFSIMGSFRATITCNFLAFLQYHIFLVLFQLSILNSCTCQINAIRSKWAYSDYKWKKWKRPLAGWSRLVSRFR